MMHGKSNIKNRFMILSLKGKVTSDMTVVEAPGISGSAQTWPKCLEMHVLCIHTQGRIPLIRINWDDEPSG
jgi:hypothetical protein